VNLSKHTIHGFFRHLKSHLSGRGVGRDHAGDEPPLRAELFSADQMEQHGKNLAGSHQLSPGRAPDLLLARLAENEDLLLGVRNLLTEAVKANRRITPAGEWLLDNYYLIEEQIRTARLHLPKGYSRELPRLMNGPSAGLPRVYDIALETISHGDGRADPESLSRFVAAYQTVSALKLGELWAIPIMLRLALIENLRRIAVRIATDRIDRNLADYWADQMTESAATDPKGLILVIADMARSNPPLVSSFVAELTRRLQGQGPSLALPLTWIEQRLSEDNQTIKQLVDSETQQQAAHQVSMSNSIGSLRFLGAMDWREFVETMSLVDKTLRKDPVDIYGKMDFSTRDRYRHKVEKIAKFSRLSEDEVARLAIRLAQEGAAGKGGEDRTAHVGFYLIDQGSAELDRLAQVRWPPSEALRKWSRRFPFLLYGGSILLLTLLFAGMLLMKAHADGLQDWPLALIGLLLFFSTSHLAIALVNWLATLLVMPHPLPRMDFSQGIPTQFRTLAVVPTMLTGAQNIAELIEAMEVRFLANRDDNLHFALLTDFRDAPAETLPEDEALLRLVRKRIEDLNIKYDGPKGDRFFLFHRPRRWNPQDRIWMGYERKRGKLADLNALLRGEAQGDSGVRFSLVVGDTAVLTNVEYVITLDTTLPDTTRKRGVSARDTGSFSRGLP
jgi:cyclic beta-1,2-glucan synthetase